ncbi:MAG TPA: TolC family protein, partial [Chthonomonadaceae bacterium]|nr:TolC family protein [Chthonomonadaceae bacterium]
MLRDLAPLIRRNAPRSAFRQKKQPHTILAALALSLAAAPCAAQTQNPPPGGVANLPQTPPPTGLQAPVPAPAAPIPKPEKPLQVSPTLNQLGGRVQAQPLTLNDAVAIALATNKSLALAEESLLRAQGRTSETRAAFNPTLGANLTYTRLDEGQSVNINGLRIPLVNADQRQIGVQATLPLDISGLLRAATQQAQFQEIAARLDINRTRNQVVLDVKTAFYNVLRNQALVNVATESLQNALDRLRDAEVKFRAGTVARFDVIRAQTDVANAQQQLITARNNVSLAIASLNNTIGIDINTPLQVSDAAAVETPPDVAPPSVPPITPGGPVPNPGAAPPPPEQNPAPNPAPPAAAPPEQNPGSALMPTYDPLELGPEYDAVLREALKTRPEILQADTNIAAARKGILLAQRSQLPTLGLSWGLSYTPDAAGFSPKETSWQAVVRIDLPLYEGGLARARVRQARADVATAETNRRQSVDLVTLDVRQAYLNLVQARNRVAVANQALAQAREAYRLARVRYNAGVSEQAGISPLLELSDAQAALTQAESNQ